MKGSDFVADVMTKQQLERQRQETSIKSMYYNRYLVIRYLCATFLFTNLYWCLFLVKQGAKSTIVPLALLLIMIPVLVEHAKLFSEHRDTTPATRRYYRVQLWVNIALLGSIGTPLFGIIYPFMEQTILAKSCVAALLLLGIALCFWALKRLDQIVCRTDKQYGRIQQLLKVIRN